MKHRFKLNSNFITPVIEGAPPARGALWKSADGREFEVLISTQVYEENGSPDPFETVYVKPSAAQAVIDDKNRREIECARTSEEIRRDLQMPGTRLISAEEAADSAAIRKELGM